MAYLDSLLGSIRCAVAASACEAPIEAPAVVEKKDPLRQPWKMPVSQAIRESEAVIEVNMAGYEKCMNSHKGEIRAGDHCKLYVEKLEKEQQILRYLHQVQKQSWSLFNYEPKV